MLKFILFSQAFVLILVFAYAIYDVYMSKDFGDGDIREYYDNCWEGELELTETYNNTETKQDFNLDWKNNKIILKVEYKRSPVSGEETATAGQPQIYKHAKVYELEGVYYWEIL